jgi:hypothetical protein
MALEFKTKDEAYTGPRRLPSGTTIWRAKIYVDTLPPGFPTTPYNPYLIIDQYSHRSRYVIDAHILIDRDMFTLAGPISKASNQISLKILQIVMNNTIERDGLDVILVDHNDEYQGTLYPISEITAAASHPRPAQPGDDSTGSLDDLMQSY